MYKKFYTLLLLVLTLAFTVSTMADSPRKGLIEEATNTSCGPCASQNPGFQKWFLENLDVLVPVIYHAWWPGANDPFYLNDQNMNRNRVQYYGVQGVPRAIFNGSQQMAPSSCPTQVDLDALRGQTSPLTITIDETRSGNDVDVKVTVHSSQAISGKKLRIVVLEYYVEYASPPGSNGEKEFYCTARKMLPDANGIDFSINADETKEFTQSFTIKAGWKASQIYIAAFIQDDVNNKLVLQAEHNLKTLSAPLSIDNKYLMVEGSSSVEKTVEVENTTNKSLDVRLSINTANSVLPSGWTASLSDYSVTIPANSKKKVTLSVKSNNEAGFAVVNIVSEPVATNVIVVKNSLNVAVLSKLTKYAVYAGGNNNLVLLYNAIKGNSKYGSKTALLPMSEDILINYDPKNLFDLVVLSFDFWHRGYFVYNGFSYVSPLAKTLKQMMAMGKKILMTGELELTNALQSYADPDARTFLNTTLGITTNGQAKIRVSTDNNGYINGINKFSAKGMSGDPITGGLNLTLNDYTDIRNHPYIIYTDIIRVTGGNNVVPILYYDNNQQSIGGVRVSIGEAKAVYYTFGFEAIRNITQRNDLVGKTLDWLFSGGGSTMGPQIETVSELNWGEVKVSQEKELTLTINNIGDEDLVIDELTMDADYDPDGVYTFVSGHSTPITIAPNSHHEVVIKFAPKNAEDYSGLLIINSNSLEDDEMLVSLEGIGIPAQGPIISSDKTTLDFRNVEIGKSIIADVVIYNTGTGDLNISNIRIDNDTDEAFSVEVGGDPGTVPPDGERTITIKFTAKKKGLHSAILAIMSNAGNASVYNVELVGNGFASGVPDEVSSNDGVITLKATPNPMGENGLITYSLNTTNTGTFEMYLMDITGRNVMNLVSGSVAAGTHTYEFNTSSLSSGTYVIVARHNASIVNLPIVIAK